MAGVLDKMKASLPFVGDDGKKEGPEERRPGPPPAGKTGGDGAVGKESEPPEPVKVLRRDDHEEGTPYARAEYNFRQSISNLTKGKRNWQIIAFACLFLALILGAALAQRSMTTRIKPFVVQMDKESGTYWPASSVGETMDANEVVKRAELANFIRDIRRVTGDYQMQKELMERGFAHLTGEAKQYVQSYYAKNDYARDPRSLTEKLTRTIEINSVVDMPDSELHKVTWTETTTPQQGGSTETQQWEALAELRQIEPENAEVAQKNPMGVFLTSLRWYPKGEG